MMALPRFELFDAAPPPTEDHDFTDQIALARQEAEAQGFEAGWQAALAQAALDDTKLHADLAKHLQALSFTWAEARTHVILAMQPVIAGMIDQLLPALARDTLRPIILDWLAQHIETAADQPAHVTVHPKALSQIAGILADTPGLPLKFHTDATLRLTEVLLRARDQEASVDLTRVIDDMAKACDTFFRHHQERLDHGRSD